MPARRPVAAAPGDAAPLCEAGVAGADIVSDFAVRLAAALKPVKPSS